MADRSLSSILEELHRAVRKKESELSELDLILADYHAEHSRLIRELRQLQAQLREAEEAISPVSGT
jgi:septal ring factor EnvC (AmiA/AmiB activator)